MDDFSKQKICYAETMRVHGDNTEEFPRFSYCAEPMFTDKTCFIAIGEHLKWLLAFMNSEIGRYLLRLCVAILDDGGYLMQKIYLEAVRIPKPKLDTEHTIELLVNQQLLAGSRKLSAQINSIFYELLSFNASEIKYIETLNSEKLTRERNRAIAR